jgi:hypothetical protein
MTNTNIFEGLSSFQAGLGSDPFENYCASALAYLLQIEQSQLTKLLTSAAGCSDTIKTTHSQSIVSDQLIDLLIELDNNERILVKINTQIGNMLEEEKLLQKNFVDNRTHWLRIGIGTNETPSKWPSLTWEQIAKTLKNTPGKLAEEFASFVETDILGYGSVTLQQARRTNKLYALAGASIRTRYGMKTQYLNSASQAVNGEYRYLGTTFSGNTADLQFWIGIVNQTLPLSSQYQLMLASKKTDVINPIKKPRVTDNWSWKSWTGLGEVKDPIETKHYEELLNRLS